MRVTTFLAAIVIVALVLMTGPWLFIWAINTLVAAGGITTFVIEFNFSTWLASMILGSGTMLLKLWRR